MESECAPQITSSSLAVVIIAASGERLGLGTQVSGKLRNGEMASVSGIKGEKKGAFITASAKGLKVRREGDDLVVNTDNSAAREIRIPVSSLGGVS